MRSFYSFFLVGLLALSLSITTYAQQTGSVEGVVQDTLGAVVVGATVTVVDSALKEKTATTNQRGEFTSRLLFAGEYSVEVEYKGRRGSVDGVAVTLGETTPVTIPLQD